ncbi:hypothetical protein HPG69_012514 [Diceros bicornis minor]|uniref:Uncharacterized protein n=1 Tax=Diceros bicornis minor TaxID=77932 RepID=A0A7J7F0B9_DICBM|nr:hypothetical protein HPG69_012514 [Diceros bicornis minor]
MLSGALELRPTAEWEEAEKPAVVIRQPGAPRLPLSWQTLIILPEMVEAPPRPSSVCWCQAPKPEDALPVLFPLGLLVSPLSPPLKEATLITLYSPCWVLLE